MDIDRSDMDLQEQRDNAILRARIKDALNDVVQWRGIARSNEELCYLDEMNECLSVLGGIVEARLTGLEPNGEEQEWDTRVKWLLDAYEMIGKVRGQRLGFHLSNLICLFQAGPYNIQTEVNGPGVSHIGQNIAQKVPDARDSVVGTRLARSLAVLAPPAQDKQQPRKKREDRRDMVRAFLERVRDETGETVRRKDVWSVAGYQNATEFERYQRNDPRTTESAKSNFDRVLNSNPQDFVRRLATKKSRLTKS